MEELKTLASLYEPDERQAFFAVREAGAQDFRPIQAANIHARAARASLNLGVPEHIRSHFAMAQNLVAYSWFCYPFNVAAELHAYISVDFALKTRFPDKANKPFAKLLEHAVDQGLLSAEGFTYGRSPDPLPYPPELLPPGDIPPVRDYVAEIAKAMRSLRNSLAHGASTIHMKGGTVLLVCSEVINQLFPPPSDG